jgi:ABC-2 type transport system ATP-binding protein
MSAEAPIVLKVQDLVIDYGKGAKKTRAVDGMSFEVSEGECVGFIGPNGAGKSSTIKTIMGFQFPTSGVVTVFGEKAGTVESRRRMGYLPEVALYYPFMKARELMELYGGLHGLDRKTLRERIPQVLADVGMAGKEDTLLKNCSKGMQQRLGIAQSIIADPELLVFDELSSGLDPVGRSDLRKVLMRLKERGRTIFFSSHELTEVEDLCDRVLIVHRGRCIEESRTEDLLKPLNRFTVEFAMNGGEVPARVRELATQVQANGKYHCEIDGAEKYSEVLRELALSNAQILEAQLKQISLEQHFMDLIRAAESGADTAGIKN